MSTYTKITKHPQTGLYEAAVWYDDYFGHHLYGVEFKSDDKVYPSDLVERKQVYEFWAEDVTNAFKRFIPGHANENEAILEFLNTIQAEYVKRWEKDPATPQPNKEGLK